MYFLEYFIYLCVLYVTVPVFMTCENPLLSVELKQFEAQENDIWLCLSDKLTM